MRKSKWRRAREGIASAESGGLEIPVADQRANRSRTQGFGPLPLQLYGETSSDAVHRLFTRSPLARLRSLFVNGNLFAARARRACSAAAARRQAANQSDRGGTRLCSSKPFGHAHEETIGRITEPRPPLRAVI